MCETCGGCAVRVPQPQCEGSLVTARAKDSRVCRQVTCKSLQSAALWLQCRKNPPVLLMVRKILWMHQKASHMQAAPSGR